VYASPTKPEKGRAPTRWAAIVAAGILAANLLCAQVDEYQVKALFLVNFARYVDWPPTSFNAPTDPILICVLGENPFGAILDQAVQGKSVDGHPLAVRVLSTAPPKGACHVLFVKESERRRFRSAAPALRAASILTVGEAAWFTSEGGVINFKLDAGKVRFEISTEAAAQQNLHVSSKLLSLAQTVKTR